MEACYYDEPDYLLVVHVKDSGTGIADEDYPKLFTRFGKLHRTSMLNHEGIGLGLLIVKQIIEASGGHINVESKGIGHGSNFFFSMRMDP